MRTKQAKKRTCEYCGSGERVLTFHDEWAPDTGPKEEPSVFCWVCADEFGLVFSQACNGAGCGQEVCNG